MKQRAVTHGRNADTEDRTFLKKVPPGECSRFWERAAVLRAATRGRISVPSEDLIRQDRDER